MMKQIALLCPHRLTDVWTIAISFGNEFIRLGWDVKYYSTFDANDKYCDIGLKQLLKDTSCGYKPDIIFNLDFGLFQSSLLNKNQYPDAFWILESGDDPQCFNLNYSKAKAGNFDLVISPDIRAVNIYNNNGIKCVWCPHFADASLFKGVNQPPIYDAVTTRSIDEPFFKELKTKLGDRFEANTKFLEGIEHTKKLMMGKMVIQNSKYKEITRRIFEGMLANRLVITDRLNQETCIGDIFTENVDIVYFDSVDDCINKINYYSINDTERLTISQNGYNKAITNHTIQKRVEKLITIYENIISNKR